MSPEVNARLKANPGWTWGMAVGYETGLAAQRRGNQFEGLKESEWRTANDDYAHGYRKAVQENHAESAPKEQRCPGCGCVETLIADSLCKDCMWLHLGAVDEMRPDSHRYAENPPL